MKTIGDLLKETKRTNLSFDKISSSTTNFSGYNFLSSPYCTLLKKDGNNTFYIFYECNDKTNMLSIYNGICKVTIEEDFIYDVKAVVENAVIEL